MDVIRNIATTFAYVGGTFLVTCVFLLLLTLRDIVNSLADLRDTIARSRTELVSAIDNIARELNRKDTDPS